MALLLKASETGSRWLAAVFVLLGANESLAAPQEDLAARKLTVELRVLVDNHTIEEAVPLALGESVQLEVEIVREDGSATDVTNHPKTRYFSTTPWILSVTNTGLVTATVSPQFNIKSYQHDVGAIAVSYGDVGDQDVGFASIAFEVRQEPDIAKDLFVTAPKTTLRVGETVQLTVIQKLPNGETRDLTTPHSGTTYFTTAESRLIPEPDGRITCIGTGGKPKESAIIGVKNGELGGDISFKLLSGGEGPSLEVTADKPILHEGEQTQLHVYERLPNGGHREITAQSTGTRYLTFPGFGRHDPSVISIDENGLASATPSIGRYRRREVIVFVRKGNAIGWIALKVIRPNA